MNQSIIHNYVEYLTKIGYSTKTIHAYSKALEQAPDTWNTTIPYELYEHINMALQSKQDLFLPTARHNIKPASSLLFLMITGISYKEYKKQITYQKSSYNDLLSEFFTYSIEWKHMTVASAESERNHVLKFLNHIKVIPDNWSCISAKEIQDYICSEFPNLKVSSMGRYVTSLRNFFRFLEYKGNPIHPSVLDLPLLPANLGKSKIPVILSLEEETRLRNHFSLDYEIGIRNTIIIQLMLDLGLRCTEVAQLSLSDIHWNKGSISIHKTKNKKSRELPISCELGKLLETYVIYYRPRVNDTHLLLRKSRNKEYTYMTKDNIRSVIRTIFQKENIQGFWKGTHTLRRTAASKLYNTGNGLKLTADLLGHESLDSTKAYVKVDFEQLKEVTSPWPGGDIHDE